jgi:hypothetical protein
VVYVGTMGRLAGFDSSGKPFRQKTRLGSLAAQYRLSVRKIYRCAHELPLQVLAIQAVHDENRII